MTPPFEHIADRIRVALAHQKLTQRELSRRAGLAETQVSVILVRLRERPYAVELETLARIAAGAQVSLFWLLTGVEEADVGAPPSLQHRPGWAAAVEGLAQRAAGASLCVRAYARERRRETSTATATEAGRACVCASWGVGA